MPLSARVAPLPGSPAVQPQGPVARALRDEMASRAQWDPQLESFYAQRGYRPLWVRGWALRPEAREVLRDVKASADDGLEPADYAPGELARALTAARSGTPAALAHAELLTSAAYAAWAADLHTPRPGAGMIYADRAVAPLRFDRRGALAFAARSASPATALAAVERMNPIYARLRDALRSARQPGRPAAARDLIRANLERARALPADLGRRYILVDAAAQTLWMYEGGRAVDSMPVVVGKVSEPTPAMAGVVRYAVARPYWNVPPDLARDKFAPGVLQQGLGFLRSQNMEVLSDWSDRAQTLDPATVDWNAVASGQQNLRLRQRPGGQNMMGKVKFVFPNPVGVYLHDTPLKALFAGTRRTESSGCVRLSDAPRLARWLLRDVSAELNRPGAPETRLDLPQPVPVYIVYFTEAPGAGGLERRPDLYGRDAPLIARLDSAASGVMAGAP